MALNLLTPFICQNHVGSIISLAYCTNVQYIYGIERKVVLMKNSTIRVKGGKRVNFSGKQVIMAGIIKIRPGSSAPGLKQGNTA